MADAEQLTIIIEDGIDRWNAWRAANPEVTTDLTEADLAERYLRAARFQNTNLQGANLEKASLAGANLTGANLRAAKLGHADISNANLQGADLTNADLTEANISEANLTGATLQDSNLTNASMNNATLIDATIRRAVLDGAQFVKAKISENTLGLGRLNQGQRGGMRLVNVQPIPEDTSQESDDQVSDNANTLTVGYAKSIVGPAHWALQSLVIPNDLTEEHRDLFAELVGAVADLHQKLAAIEEENRRLADENEDLRNSVDLALPLWKRAFEEFVLKSAGGLGMSAANGAAFGAGFIAGTLYNTLSPGDSGINI